MLVVVSEVDVPLVPLALVVGSRFMLRVWRVSLLLSRERTRALRPWSFSGEEMISDAESVLFGVLVVNDVRGKSTMLAVDGVDGAVGTVAL